MVDSKTATSYFLCHRTICGAILALRLLMASHAYCEVNVDRYNAAADLARQWNQYLREFEKADDPVSARQFFDNLNQFLPLALRLDDNKPDCRYWYVYRGISTLSKKVKEINTDDLTSHEQTWISLAKALAGDATQLEAVMQTLKNPSKDFSDLAELCIALKAVAILKSEEAVPHARALLRHPYRTSTTNTHDGTYEYFFVQREAVRTLLRFRYKFTSESWIQGKNIKLLEEPEKCKNLPAIKMWFDEEPKAE